MYIFVLILALSWNMSTSFFFIIDRKDVCSLFKV